MLFGLGFEPNATWWPGKASVTNIKAGKSKQLCYNCYSL